ncbi:serine protease 52-like [Epargyreus clarus]|uniref:serine protease 52-like n=1 Tax=Epargyreus clarus TaxID=520877 RepID=UPI003C2F85E9
MESFVVGGAPAKIQYFGHSAFLSVGNFVCGSSLLNQNVLLSAAHCFEEIDGRTQIWVTAGNSNKYRGAVRYGTKVALHGSYDEDTVSNDIALLYVKKPFVMGQYIKRVILMKSPPKSRVANVAGWGLTDERKQLNTDWLQYTEQKLWSRNECVRVLHTIPLGSICGGAKFGNSYASAGDSGSALITDGYVQIGIVSFKKPEISRGLVVYTDVPFYYDWIKKTSQKLVCSY